MYSIQPLSHQGRAHGSLGKTLPGIGLVRKSQTINLGAQLDNMRPRHFPYALRDYFRSLPEGSLDDAAHGLGRTARSVKLVDMVNLLDIRGVTVSLEDSAGPLNSREESIHPYREIGSPDESCPAAAERTENILLDVVPSRRADHYSLETGRQKTIIGPEGVRRGEINAHRPGRDILRK